jgi:hypothetical protein
MAPACAIIIVSTAWYKKFHGQAHLGTRQDDGSIKKEIPLIETGQTDGYQHQTEKAGSSDRWGKRALHGSLTMNSLKIGRVGR